MRYGSAGRQSGQHLFGLFGSCTGRGHATVQLNLAASSVIGHPGDKLPSPVGTRRQATPATIGIALADGEPPPPHDREDVSEHPSWTSIIGRPVDVGIRWNDYGTGRPPCADAVKLSTSAGAAWVITADSERHESTLKVQLGLDEIMVIFDEKFREALGLFDRQRGRVDE